MSFKARILEQAKQLNRTIVLPEVLDKRILEAAQILTKQKIAKRVYLIGDSKAIEARLRELDLEINECCLVDPLRDEYKEEYALSYYELRKSKGLSKEEAYIRMQDPLHYAAMMVRKGRVHGLLAGAVHTTAEVLKAGLTIIKTSTNVKTASSYFIMDTHNPLLGEEGLMLFSDCGMVPDPSAEQLAEIAVTSANSFKVLLNKEPRVAMLSFSTKGSASSASSEKVIYATSLAKEKAPELLIDGELQLDAAIVEEVARIKAPNSPLAGKANILIFPNLDAGNIGYKLVQRFGSADAYGPLLQGFACPISDLSRGCTTQEAVMTAALVLCQERG